MYSMQMQKDLCILFIDYEKAFDNARPNELVKCLEGAGIGGKDLRIFMEIYWNKKATPQMNGASGKWIQLLKGARLGCGLFPEFSMHLQKKSGKERGLRRSQGRWT